MTNCIICLENKTKMAYCETCMESGQICHICILKWGKNNDITICTICKQETMKNLPITYIDICKKIINIIINIIKWCLIALLLSLLFSSFSYFMVFKLDEDNYVSKFYIVIGCGSIFGIPFTYFFRKRISLLCFG